VTDEEMARLPTSLFGKLVENGVNVKLLRSPILMHHNFLIVDNRLLFNGSFNWTKQAVGFNFETMFISNDPNVVNPYRFQCVILLSMYFLLYES
jgi:cardiolipin hydrolase